METKGILFLVQTHKAWELEKEYQVFYDSLQKRVILHQSFNVYAFEMYDNTKDPNPVYFSLPATYKEIQALAISRGDQYMAIQDTLLHISFVYFGSPTLDINREKAQIKQANITFSPDKLKILGVSFVQSPAVDMLACHCKGLELYKFNKNLENIKTISYKSLGAWINPLEGIIILSSSSSKGEMQAQLRIKWKLTTSRKRRLKILIMLIIKVKGKNIKGEHSI